LTCGLVFPVVAALAAGCQTGGGGSGTGTGGQVGTGGSTATGGTGGSSRSGSGGTGAPGTGGAASGTGGIMATGGAPGTGGLPAAGGSRGTGGTPAGAGGAAGGAPGTGGTGGGSPDSGVTAGACPGVPIVPDAHGFVAPASNTLGIHGSWFEYSDCADLGGKNCATVTTPPANSFPNTGGKMCTAGMTSSATGAWGAGIALELNDGPPQMPYDTTVHNVKGFCFVLSGTAIPSTTIRVAFPTQHNNDNAYFEAVSTPGPHTVLFSDAAQGSWVTSKSAFEPTKVMLLQFQIPSSTTAPVPWNFCVEGLTAVTQ
ncbi:MAG: hypothetical protein ABUS79_13175, partial [Pseudomonadota bacterium]